MLQGVRGWLNDLAANLRIMDDQRVGGADERSALLSSHGSIAITPQLDPTIRVNGKSMKKLDFRMNWKSFACGHLILLLCLIIITTGALVRMNPPDRILPVYHRHVTMTNNDKINVKLAGKIEYFRAMRMSNQSFSCIEYDGLSEKWLVGSSFYVKSTFVQVPSTSPQSDDLFDNLLGNSVSLSPAWKLSTFNSASFAYYPHLRQICTKLNSTDQQRFDNFIFEPDIGGTYRILVVGLGYLSVVSDELNLFDIVTEMDFDMFTDATTFALEKQSTIKGVNIGGWMIPEPWLTPELFKLDLHSASNQASANSLCHLVKELGYSKAETRVVKHYESWLTWKDFDALVHHDISSIRISVGYWNFVDDPQDLFVPRHAKTSLKYLDWAFKEARSRHITIILVLQGAPGSQNGWDESGCVTFGCRWNTDSSRNLTLDVISKMTERYHNWENLLAIEIMSNPAYALEINNHNTLVSFYHEAYSAIRRYSSELIVVFSVHDQDNFYKWTAELLEPEYYNVVMDWHLYSELEVPYTSSSSPTNHSGNISAPSNVSLVPVRDLSARYAELHSWSNAISAHHSHAVMVGEWSVSATGDDARQTYNQAFLTAQLQAWQPAWAWYYWNFKVSNAYRSWSYESMVEDGLHFDRP